MAIIGPLLFELFILFPRWLLLLLLFAGLPFVLVKFNGPRDVMSGDDDAESLDFLESLLLEFERDIFNYIKKREQKEELSKKNLVGTHFFLYQLRNVSEEYKLSK